MRERFEYKSSPSSLQAGAARDIHGNALPSNAFAGGNAKMIEKRFGWKGPANGRTQFDILPLVVQIDPDEPPELFPMPASLAAPIAIWHPKSLGRRRR